MEGTEGGMQKGEKEGIHTHQEGAEGVEGDEVGVSHHGAAGLGSRVLRGRVTTSIRRET